METREKGTTDQEQRAIAVASGGAASRQTLRNTRLIIWREYKNRVTQRVFIITSIILLIIVFLAQIHDDGAVASAAVTATVRLPNSKQRYLCPI